jgi:acyl carrier protein
MTAVHDHEAVLAKIFGYLEKSLPQRPATIPRSGQSLLIADLGLDSLQSFEMVADLEDHFEITVAMEALQNINTLDDVARVIVRALEDRPA